VKDVLSAENEKILSKAVWLVGLISFTAF